MNIDKIESEIKEVASRNVPSGGQYFIVVTEPTSQDHAIHTNMPPEKLADLMEKFAQFLRTEFSIRRN